MGASPVEIVRASLRHYAARGAFRSFSELPHRGGVRFQFVWFRDVMFHVAFDPRTLTLTFVNLLPAVPARSAMDRHFRSFVSSRSDRSVPEHRRVDRKKVGVTIVNRRGQLSLVCTLRPRLLEYGVRKAVHLVHEVLMDFLNEPQYVQYNVDYFNLNPEMA
ncbi:MAG: hypothetical protein LBQ09_03345 [Acidobacteriaceae bacterium]|nr:hypothetical protein [Acidobacteriaceae bacterium]